MSRRFATVLTVVVILTAGCSATAQPTDEPRRTATLSLSGYEQTENASSTETRAFWDRSKSWEDPGSRNVTVTSHAYAYDSPNGNNTVVVYTTAKKKYVGADRIRSRPAADRAELATRPISARSFGNASGPGYRAELLGTNTTVRTVADAANGTTAHVAHATSDDAIVVVVVLGETDRQTVGRILHGITYDGSGHTSGE